MNEKVFTEKEANILIKFYYDKIIGRNILLTLDYKIISLTKEFIDKDKYLVVATSNMTPEFAIIKRGISNIAKDLNLPLPSEVLLNHNQSQ